MNSLENAAVCSAESSCFQEGKTASDLLQTNSHSQMPHPLCGVGGASGHKTRKENLSTFTLSAQIGINGMSRLHGFEHHTFGHVLQDDP